MMILVLTFLISFLDVEMPEQATFDWFMPGPRFESPEIVLQSYWQTMNEQNLPKIALHFSYVTLIEAKEIAQEMMPCNIKNYGIEILETTIVNDTLVHFQYLVRLEKRQFKSGDLMVYNPDFGWRILLPMTDPPDANEFK